MKSKQRRMRAGDRRRAGACQMQPEHDRAVRLAGAARAGREQNGLDGGDSGFIFVA
ncbi:MAG: hypothetical protein ACLP01_00115 [Solirubrobacteraceae bacterium]